jgi:alkylation response protein AidB-like acyl-CoA dehydrogenase
MSQFDLTEDQRAIQDMARRFTADAITPHAAEWDEDHHFPRDVCGGGRAWLRRDLCVRGMAASASAAGSGADHGGDGLWLPSTSAFISIHNMATWMIDSFGGGRQGALPARSCRLENGSRAIA